MRIQSLYVESFLGIRKAELALAQPVQFFCGRNGAGKSSIRDAVALALTADLGRVGLKKEAGQLVRGDATSALAEVVTADGDTYTVSITAGGKITDSQKGRETNPLLPYAMDAQAFARLDATDRRKLLMAVTGTKADPAAVRQRLAARGCDAAKVERIGPLLRAGFDAASKEAKSKATEAKGAWRAVTGETYGSEKAKDWRAAVPPYDAKAAERLAAELQGVDAAIGRWQQTVGEVQGEEKRRAELRAQLPAAEEHASRVERIETKLATDRKNLAEAETALALARVAAGQGERVGLVHELAESCWYLLSAWPINHNEHTEAAQARLNAYEAEFGPLHTAAGDAEAAARLQALQAARETCDRAVSNSQRDLSAALQARDMAERIRAELAEEFDAAGLAEARAQIETLQTQRAEIQQKADALKTAKAAADAAEKKTADAARHAADVAAWDLLGDALGPDGIPADILADALGPINARLAQSAADSGWPQAAIGADMAITYGGRDYRLVSESEQYRADAMLAEAIAHLSGTRLLVLDRFDVLDLQGRTDLIAWLDVLAANGEIDTALVFGTTKSLPAGLPVTCGAHWVEAGVVGQLKEAA